MKQASSVQFTRPADTILFTEGTGASPENIADGGGVDKDKVKGQVDVNRHNSNERFMVGFADGHVKFVNADETLRAGAGGANDIMWNSARP